MSKGHAGRAKTKVNDEVVFDKVVCDKVVCERREVAAEREAEDELGDTESNSEPHTKLWGKNNHLLLRW